MWASALLSCFCLRVYASVCVRVKTPKDFFLFFFPLNFLESKDPPVSWLCCVYSIFQVLKKYQRTKSTRLTSVSVTVVWTKQLLCSYRLTTSASSPAFCCCCCWCCYHLPPTAFYRPPPPLHSYVSLTNVVKDDDDDDDAKLHRLFLCWVKFRKKESGWIEEIKWQNEF